LLILGAKFCLKHFFLPARSINLQWNERNEKPQSAWLIDVWRAVWKEGERKKLKSAENETRALRPRARQIGCAGQFAIPEVIEDA
jgi:hypothetical protein